MKIPKFILGDHSEYPNSIFVIHTEFPRFIIDLENDEIEWLEVFDTQDEKLWQRIKRDVDLVLWNNM